MIPSLTRKLPLTALILVGGLAVGTTTFSIGQEKKGRLPPYYADIVTDEQRQQIYALREKYGKTLATLQEQIAKLEKQRDAEIEAVLDGPQKAQLKKAQEQGAAKRKKNAADKKAAEQKTAADRLK